MTKYTLLFLFILLFASCGKDTHSQELSGKLVYSGIEIGPLERYVVKDLSNSSYEKISDNPFLSAKAKMVYDSIFEMDRIDTIEFKGSLYTKYSIYSKGIISDTIKGSYISYTNTNFISLYGYIDKIFVVLFMEPNGIYKFPYHMSFSIRQSKYPAIENIISKGNFILHPEDERIKNQIKAANLKLNDTVYYNEINLIYKAY